MRDGRIWRLSFGSSALICTQVAVTGFVVIFLESQRGFTAMEAGLVLAAINVSGRSRAARCQGAGRTAAGGGRVRLIRVIGAATTVAVAAAGVLAGSTVWLLVPALVVGGGLAMSWNALAVAADGRDGWAEAGAGRRSGCSRR